LTTLAVVPCPPCYFAILLFCDLTRLCSYYTDVNNCRKRFIMQKNNYYDSVTYRPTYVSNASFDGHW